MSVHRRTVVRALVVSVLAAFSLVTVPVATHAVSAGSVDANAQAPVTGLVRDAAGNPIAGVGVSLWSADPNCSICDVVYVTGNEVTGSDGRFSVDPTEWAYEMRLEFYPPEGSNFHRAVYPNAWRTDDGAELDAGDDVVMTMPLGGTVSGAITTQGDVPSTKIRLRGTEEDEHGSLFIWTSPTKMPAAGAYEAGAVPAGAYTLQFCVNDNTGQGDFTSWCPSGNIVPFSGGDVSVSAGNELTGKDVTLIGAPPAVLNTARPTITGTPRVGSTLRTTGGSWSPSAVTRTYQWLVDGVLISGATQSSYVVPPSMRGEQLAVRVRASAPEHTPTSRTSDDTAPVATGAFAQRTAPRVTGTLRVGQRLTATAGTWTPTPTRTAYQWLAGGRAISGATGTRLTLTRAMRGKRISVRVTVSRPSYTTRSVTVTRGTLG